MKKLLEFSEIFTGQTLSLRVECLIPWAKNHFCPNLCAELGDALGRIIIVLNGAEGTKRLIGHSITVKAVHMCPLRTIGIKRWKITCSQPPRIWGNSPCFPALVWACLGRNVVRCEVRTQGDEHRVMWSWPRCYRCKYVLQMEVLYLLPQRHC